MFPVNVNIDGLSRRFNTLAESAEDLTPALRKFGGYLRKKAIAIYKVQDFAALAPSTIEHRARKGIHSLQRKLARDVRRALKRARQQRARAPRGILQRLLASKAAERALDDVISAQTRGARNRIAVLAEFERRHGMGDSHVASAADARPLSIKQLASLGARTDRSVAKYVGRPILGGLPSSLEVQVKRGSMTLISRTERQWTEIHNKGGTAGHGAKIPERKTIGVTEADLDVFQEILIELQLLPAFNEGASDA